MGCNAWNHDPDCPCDFRGGHGFGGGGGGRRRLDAISLEPVARGWSRARGDGTFASYVNPNARCPTLTAEHQSFSINPHTAGAFSSTRRLGHLGRSTPAPIALAWGRHAAPTLPSARYPPRSRPSWPSSQATDGKRPPRSQVGSLSARRKPTCTKVGCC
jgi:hypothetical protein